MDSQSGLSEAMRKEIPLTYYLQQHENSRNQHTKFSQMSDGAESLQTTMSPYCMDAHSVSSNKQLMVFTGTDLN